MKIIGIDEAGRGNCMGFIYAAAVAIKNPIQDPWWEELNDSKQLSEEKRFELELLIKKNMYWGIGSASPEEIDRLNILKADFLAMNRAVISLLTQMTTERIPEYKVIVDGDRVPTILANIDYHQIVALVKADTIYKEVMAASILAKTSVDYDMLVYDKVYPGYGLATNKGYATEELKDAIRKNGELPIQRKSFELKIFKRDFFHL